MRNIPYRMRFDPSAVLKRMGETAGFQGSWHARPAMMTPARYRAMCEWWAVLARMWRTGPRCLHGCGQPLVDCSASTYTAACSSCLRPCRRALMLRVPPVARTLELDHKRTPSGLAPRGRNVAPGPPATAPSRQPPARNPVWPRRGRRRAACAGARSDPWRRTHRSGRCAPTQCSKDGGLGVDAAGA